MYMIIANITLFEQAEDTAELQHLWKLLEP